MSVTNGCTHITRAVEEENQLRIRISKLDVFLRTQPPEHAKDVERLDEAYLALCREQLGHMKEYRRVLRERIIHMARSEYA